MSKGPEKSYRREFYLPNLAQEVDNLVDIKRKFGKFEFTFGKGEKGVGDYIILVNGIKSPDSYMWDEVLKHVNSNLKDIILRLLAIIECLWCQILQEEEKEVYDTILKFESNFPETYKLIRQNNIDLDVVQAFLYYSWHRCRVEERSYPSVLGFNGRKDYLRATYVLFANVYNLQINDKLRNSEFKNPKKVYEWAQKGENKELKKLAFKSYKHSISDWYKLVVI